MNLQGKKVAVLGGTSGIGFAIARQALAEGALVYVSSSSADRVQSAVAALGVNAQGFVADLRDATAIEDLFARIGAIDHLVYTAGDSLLVGELASMDVDTLGKAFEVRVFGAIAAVKAATPRLRQGGSIVLTSGVASLRPRKGWAVLASVCGAMESLTRGLAVELAPLRVNLVSPGFTRTELWSNIPVEAREAMYQEAGAQLLTGRVGEADEVAQTYIHLMSNPFVTGQTFIVDGGGVLV